VTHKRQVLREAIVAILEAIPGWEGRVFANRTRPTDATELPVALVYTVNEDATMATIGGTLRRRLTVAIELRVSVSSSLDNALDDLAQKAEVAMAVDPKLKRKALYSALTGSTMGLDGEGDSRQALMTMTYDIQYQTDGSAN
jgi:hypothetical protein